MTIENIAIVRATNILPFNGELCSISNSYYLRKNTNLEFSRSIRKLLQKKGIIPPLDYSKFSDQEYLNNYNKMVDSILKDYIPYNSDYNSVVLFSLNGLVPDDSEIGFGNNIFSNKVCAVIDSLSSHLDQVVSLVPTDTALKGNVKLSKDSVVLINEEYYSSLNDYEKNLLKKTIIK